MRGNFSILISIKLVTNSSLLLSQNSVRKKVTTAKFLLQMSETSIRAIRPQTKRLERPTPNINHPIIDAVPSRSPRQSPEAIKTTNTSNEIFDNHNNTDKIISKVEQRTYHKPFSLQSVPTKSTFDHSKRSSIHQSSDERKSKTKDSSNSKNSMSVPAPCTACDRDIAPERLHSHTPPGWRPKLNEDGGGERKALAVKSYQSSKDSTKSAETSKVGELEGEKKILAIKYHQQLDSTKNNSNSKISEPVLSRSKATNNNATLRNNNSASQENVTKPSPVQNGVKSDVGVVKGPPLLLCYICGRCFGSKSLPLHEPKCLEKWKWENDSLPPEQQRPLPERPDKSLSRNEYNEVSWQIFNSQLIPCSKCGRTFFANRLPVHERACKGQAKSPSAPPKVTPRISNGTQEDEVSPDIPSIKRTLLPPRSVPCYICGRMFGSMSISVHEPQCLKKWRIENEQLPSHLQRPEPVKPAIALKEDGTIDVDAVAEASWQSHLQQLVPCSRCGRTFFPDRLPIHERSCKMDPLDQANLKPQVNKEEIRSAH